MPIRIILFDDNAERRDSLQLLLELYEDFEFVRAFDNCLNVVEKVRATRPDVVLMDIEMPDINGIEGVKAIKAEFPDMKILMQTVFEDDENVFESILAGASGYILKKTDSDKVAEAIREVYADGAPMTPTIARKVLEWMKKQAPDTTPQVETFELSEREKEILSLLVQGLSYKMIAEKCFISYHTVNSHLKKIYDKLHVHSQAEAVSKALKNKIV